jgi:geranylgeranyl diphosphate synthase type II
MAALRTHALYLATIAALVLILAAAARASRRQKAAWAAARVSRPRAAPLREEEAYSAPGPRAAALLADKTYEERRREVDGLVARAQALGEFAPGEGRPPGRLAAACAHAPAGGKRLRPIITLEVARAAALARGEAPVDAAEAALAVEYLHASSLVIDDLPAFDDDAERRGAPSLHARAGAATAQMAALSLVAAAFQGFARQVDWIRDCSSFPNPDLVGARLCHDVAASLGSEGAARGQYMDAVLPAAELFEQHGDAALLELMEKKTATFFEVAFLAGWLVAGGGADAAARVQRAGRLFGTAYQIADDLGDMEQDAARQAAGKPGWNYANAYGAPAAAAAVEENLAACRALLAGEGLETPLWAEIFGKVRRMAEP